MKILLALLLVCLGGLTALYAQTDAFTVVTTESARRADIARTPRVIPQAQIQTASGSTVALRDMLRQDGRLTIINFVFTRCVSICLAMGSELQQLQSTLKARRLDDRVRILSLSFDPADTPKYLSRYAATMQADDKIWQFATLVDPAQRRALLKVFGIIVVPAPYGQFEHNAAYHVVTPSGRLERILDIGSTDAVLAYVTDHVSQHQAMRADPVTIPRPGAAG